MAWPPPCPSAAGHTPTCRRVQGLQSGLLPEPHSRSRTGVCSINDFTQQPRRRCPRPAPQLLLPSCCWGWGWGGNRTRNQRGSGSLGSTKEGQPVIRPRCQTVPATPHWHWLKKQPGLFCVFNQSADQNGPGRLNPPGQGRITRQ